MSRGSGRTIQQAPVEEHFYALHGHTQPFQEAAVSKVASKTNDPLQRIIIHERSNSPKNWEETWPRYLFTEGVSHETPLNE